VSAISALTVVGGIYKSIQAQLHGSFGKSSRGMEQKWLKD